MYTKKDREQHEETTKYIIDQLARQYKEMAEMRERIDLLLSHIEKARASKKAIIPKQG